MAISKNDASRCSLHIAILVQHKDIVKHIVKKYPKTIHIGDNVIQFEFYLHLASSFFTTVESYCKLSFVLVRTLDHLHKKASTIKSLTEIATLGNTLYINYTNSQKTCYEG